MKVTYSALSDVGLSRQNNEDAYLVDEELGLYIVADGMGGSAAGEVASRTLCDTLHKHVKDRVAHIEAFDQGQTELGPRAMLDLLAEGIRNANDEIYKQAQENAEMAGMGTTVVAILAVGEHIFMAHVGDSRVYLLREGKIHQLTRDHSLVEELKQLGKIQDSKEVRAKYRNAITRAVGVYESIKVDTLDMVPLPGDRFLMCSDGLYSTANAEELVFNLEKIPGDEAVENLIRHANSRGGKDNITAVLMDIEEVEPNRADNTQQKLAALRKVPLFKYLTFDEVLKVVSLFQEVHFQPNTTICKERDSGNELFVLIDGEVEIVKGGVKLTTLSAGDHFGELALLDREPRSADVITTRECFCITMERKKFYTLVREGSQLAVKMMWSLSQVIAARLRQTTDELGFARSQSARVRLPARPTHPFLDHESPLEDGPEDES